ncbi:speckle-type POZ protein B-like [Trichogramma pretiosum]|uniref:speckle-type POZ protein B-like n=1 Tax=Trichogramma pretiosum TaxID=7493 RepID=UPI0006C93FE8|nr:speckle-type POZ protein B-like [Trichogramma pretiosum]
MESTKRMKLTTKAVTERGSYTWTIKNYSMIKAENGESIESPEFSVGSDDKKYFKLKLYPEGEREKAAGFISIFLYYLKTDSTKNLDKLVCRSKVSVINDEKVVTQSTLHEDFMQSRQKSWGWSKFYELEDIDKLISSKNTVTIQCELEVFKEYESSLDSKNIDSTDETINGVKFDSAFLSEELSDVELISSDESAIRAHKIVLAMASPVFKAMFTHDMLESKNNSVEIMDTPYDILVEMLRFIYTGKIANTKVDVILNLLTVADKYQIDNLKIKCGKILQAELTTENAIEILEAAHKYDEKYLKHEALEFVKTHIRSFVETEELKKISEPELLFNVIQTITNFPK